MEWLRWSQFRSISSLLLVVAAAACSQDPIGPGGLDDPNPPGESPALEGLIVSEPIGDGPGSVGLAYVSLTPGSLPAGASVQIRNATADGPALPPISVVHGGFDPVAVAASRGDRLQLWIRDVPERGAMATVPERRAPVVVSTSVRNPGEFDPRPRVVFSEPIDPATVPGHVRITRGGAAVSDRFAVVPDEPWVAQLDAAVELASSTTYELIVEGSIRDLAGEPLQAPLTVTFSTGFELEGLGRIAFASDRDGEIGIYAVQADGTGLLRIATGWSPAWSPDGSRMAFYRDGLRVIDADGADERLLVADGHDPAWTFDGRRIAFMRGWDLYVVNADGSDEALLVSASSVSIALGINAQLHSPAWSPDGRQIAFATNEGSIVLADADGSGIRRFAPQGAMFWNASLRDPAWSPGGSRIAFTASNGSIASAAPDGSDVRVHADTGGGAKWSADGRYLVYSYTIGCHSDWECSTRIRVLDLASGRFKRLIPDVAAANPTYSDGSPVWSR